jgi:hypothetical protein
MASGVSCIVNNGLDIHIVADELHLPSLYLPAIKPRLQETHSPVRIPV